MQILRPTESDTLGMGTGIFLKILSRWFRCSSSRVVINCVLLPQWIRLEVKNYYILTLAVILKDMVTNMMGYTSLPDIHCMEEWSDTMHPHSARMQNPQTFILSRHWPTLLLGKYVIECIQIQRTAPSSLGYCVQELISAKLSVHSVMDGTFNFCPRLQSYLKLKPKLARNWKTREKAYIFLWSKFSYLPPICKYRGTSTITQTFHYFCSTPFIEDLSFPSLRPVSHVIP